MCVCVLGFLLFCVFFCSFKPGLSMLPWQHERFISFLISRDSDVKLL